MPAIEFTDNFGGVFGQAASGAYEVQRAVDGPEHDAALRAALRHSHPPEEALPGMR